MIKRLNEEELNEVAGFSGAVKDWIASGGARDFDGFFDTKGSELQGLRKNNSFKKAFEELYDRISKKSSVASSAPGLERDESPASDALNQLISDTEGISGAKSEADTVVEKYSKMERKFRRVLLGKSDKRYFILMGDPGIGKTYTVTKLCGKYGVSCPTYTGDIGSNPTAVYLFLWEHKDDKIFILDDCDSMIKKAAPDVVRNALKGAMGAPAHTLTMSSTINSIVNKKWRASQEESTERANKLFNSNIDALSESLHTLLGKTEKLEESEDNLFELREATDNDVNKMKVILENAFWIDLCCDEELKEKHLKDIIRKNGIILTNELYEEISDLINRNKLEESYKKASKLNKYISKLNERLSKADYLSRLRKNSSWEECGVADDPNDPDYNPHAGRTHFPDGAWQDPDDENIYYPDGSWIDQNSQWHNPDGSLKDSDDLNEGVYDDEDDDEDDLFTPDEDDGMLNTDKFAEKIPTTFVFNAGMIIISNCTEKDIDSALLSRSDYATISLTPGEYMVRLAAIIDNIEVRADEAIAKKTKGLIMSTLPLLIEASKKGKSIGGRQVVFRHPLEFRMISTLCEDMDGRIEDEVMNGLSVEAAFNKVYPKWVVYDFIPAL